MPAEEKTNFFNLCRGFAHLAFYFAGMFAEGRPAETGMTVVGHVKDTDRLPLVLDFRRYQGPKRMDKRASCCALFHAALTLGCIREVLPPGTAPHFLFIYLLTPSRSGEGKLILKDNEKNFIFTMCGACMFLVQQ